MRKSLFFVFVLCILSTIFYQTPSFTKETVRAYTIEYSPLSIKKGRASTGLACNLLKKIGRRINLKIPITFGIWKKSYSETEHNPSTVLFPTTLTDERKDKFIWVGPFCTSEYFIYKSPTTNLSLTIAEDVRNVSSIATVKEYALNTKLEELGCRNLKYYKTPQAAIVAVILGKSDICIFPSFIVDTFNRDSGYSSIESLSSKKSPKNSILTGEGGVQLSYGTSHESYEDVSRRHKQLGHSGASYSNDTKIIPVIPFMVEDLYFALNKDTPLDLAKAMQNALLDIEEDGTLLKLFKKYFIAETGIPTIPSNPILPPNKATITTTAPPTTGKATQATEQSRTLKIYAEDFPPFTFSSTGARYIQGAVAELVTKIQENLGQTPIKIIISNWNDVFSKAKSTPYSVLCTLKRIPEREDDFYWIGPYAADSAWLYARRDFPDKVTTIPEAKNIKSIASVDKTFAYTVLTNNGFSNIQAFNTPNEAVTSIMKNQDSAAAFSSVSAPYIIRNAGYSAVNVKPLLQLSRKTNYYIGISKLTPKEIALEWQKAFEDIRARGELASIMKRWIK